MYITYDKDTMYSTGCSSSLPSEPYIELESVDEMFYGLYHCFKVDVDNNKLIYDENKYKEYLEIKNNSFTPMQRLAQENTQLQIEMLKLQMTLGLPTTLSNKQMYWEDRFTKKYANKKQINELIELGVITNI